MNTLKAAAIALVAVFAPVQAALITTLVLIGADLVTGVWAAIKRKEPITSAGIRRTITKLFVYQAALMLGYLGQKYLLSDMIPVVKLVSSLVGVVELKSIFENLDSISGQDLLKTVIAKLQSDNEKKS